jgi:hypothetical protein
VPSFKDPFFSPPRYGSALPSAVRLNWILADSLSRLLLFSDPNVFTRSGGFVEESREKLAREINKHLQQLSMYLRKYKAEHKG